MNQYDFREKAYAILLQAYGPTAAFRDGQLDAIEHAMFGNKTLVVQKTGWGKSLVYFIATRILRDYGAGPTIIISPLLALMQNQVESAKAFGVAVAAINSENTYEWSEIYARLQANEIDALIISPERLANDKFMNNLSEVRNIQLLVVDEAHAISDWGHDFRPDYQRVSKLIASLPGNVHILGTTATANNRVIEDIKHQLGNDLAIVRGDLMRKNLAIQVNPAQSRSQRLAWLVQALTQSSVLSNGQGIIYCLTHNDCDAVSDYLAKNGVSVLPYYSGMGNDENDNSIEQGNLTSFIERRTRILVATVKLGMGYDKSDIRFVIHFQLPANIIAYYQQIGRAGRDGLQSYAILLHGPEDEEIHKFFIDSAQSNPDLLDDIVRGAQYGITLNEILQRENVRNSSVKDALKYLLVHDFIYKDGSTYRANTGKTFDIDVEKQRQDRISQSRIDEYHDMQRFLNTRDCYMRYLAHELDAPDGQHYCRICANCCQNHLVSLQADQYIVQDATQYLGSRHAIIRPRKQWSNHRNIPERHRMQQGWCLCADYYSEAGQKVRQGKYQDGFLSMDLLNASAHYLSIVTSNKGIDCVVPVPSRRRPNLVPNFARALAQKLGILFEQAVIKTQDSKEQKTLLNSYQQQENIESSVGIDPANSIAGKTVLLVDDMVDSRWSFTVIASKLLEAGAKAVYPYALVRTGNSD